MPTMKSKSQASCCYAKQGNGTGPLPINPLLYSLRTPLQQTAASHSVFSSTTRNSKRRDTPHTYSSTSVTNAMATGTDPPPARRKRSAENVPRKTTPLYSVYRTHSDVPTVMGNTKHGMWNAHQCQKKESA